MGEMEKEIYELIKSSIYNIGLNKDYMTSFSAHNVPVNFGLSGFSIHQASGI